MTYFADRTIWTGDNLDILRGINSAWVDLIYQDPPFNSNRNYAAPVASAAAGAAFKDTWTLSDLDVAWMGLIADEQPAMYQVLQVGRSGPREGDSVLPVHDGGPVVGNATGTQGHRINLSSLRPDGQPLLEDVDGQHLRSGELP